MTRRFEPQNLSRVKGWAAQGGSVWDFLGAQGSELAVAFSTLFWPAFVEVNGCVLLEEHYDHASFLEWWRKLGGDVRQVESVINHVHLWDLFDADQGAVPEAAIHDLAEILAKTWACALRNQFPKRIFEVSVNLDDVEDYGPTVTLSTANPVQ